MHILIEKTKLLYPHVEPASENRFVSTLNLLPRTASLPLQQLALEFHLLRPHWFSLTADLPYSVPSQKPNFEVFFLKGPCATLGHHSIPGWNIYTSDRNTSNICQMLPAISRIATKTLNDSACLNAVTKGGSNAANLRFRTTWSPKTCFAELLTLISPTQSGMAYVICCFLWSMSSTSNLIQ